jgi:hypothetical protein
MQSALDDTARRSLIARYVVAVFLYWMALYLYVPTLPTYAESKSDTLSLVGVVGKTAKKRLPASPARA